MIQSPETVSLMSTHDIIIVIQKLPFPTTPRGVNNHNMEVLLARSKRRHTTSHTPAQPQTYRSSRWPLAALSPSTCQPPRASKGRWCVRLSLTGLPVKIDSCDTQEQFAVNSTPVTFRVPRLLRQKVYFPEVNFY